METQNSNMPVIRATDISLYDLKIRFGLQLSDDEKFFQEWQTELPEITDADKHTLDRIKAGYLNLIEYPPTLEDTVKMAVLGPILNLAGFYLPPFHIKTEISVNFSDTDQGVTVEGKIDILVLREQFWVMVIESKRAILSLEVGLPQIVAYMLANHHPDRPGFGLITNGGSFIFIKLVRNKNIAWYAVSKIFEIRNPANELYAVLQILKKIGQVMISE